MPSRRLLACAVSWSLTSLWTYVALAQTDSAPVTSEPAPPTQPPAAAPEPAPPPSEPPAASPPAPPPADAFPFPPSQTPPATTPTSEPAVAPAPPPTASSPEAPLSPPASADERVPAKKPSEGLFQPKTPAAGAPPADQDERGKGTDQFKIGPVVGVGVPSVLSFGGTLKVTRFLGAGVNIGLIPKVQLSYYGDATLSYQHYDIYGRVYPFGGGFFLSAGAGYATVDGTLSSQKTVSASGFSGTVDYNSKGSVRTLMLTALIGYFYTTSIGFSFGVDAGAQIPIAPSHVTYGSTYDVSSNVPAVARAEFDKRALPIKQETDKSVQDTLEKIGRTTLPTINLRIGWIL